MTTTTIAPAARPRSLGRSITWRISSAGNETRRIPPLDKSITFAKPAARIAQATTHRERSAMTTTIAGAPPARPLHRDPMIIGWSVAYGISAIGDEIWYVALTWSAARLGSPALAGLVLACGSVPHALLLLLGGAFADRWNTRRLMIGSDLARVIVLLGGLLVLATAGSSVGLLITVAVLFGVVDAIYDPAAATLPRQLVAKSELGRLAGIRQLCLRIGTFGGAPLGGLVVAASGLGGAMLADAMSFLVIALVLVGVRPRWTLERTAAGRGAFGDVRDGLRYLKETPHVRDLVVALSGLNVFMTPVIAVGVVVRAQHEGWGAGGVGLLTGTLGVGAAVGTAIAMRWRPRRSAFTGLVILFTQPTAMVLAGFAPLTGVFVAMAAVGVTAGLASPMLSGAFQATVGERYLGRCGAVGSTADAALTPLALAGFGALAGATGVAVASAAFAAGYVVLLAYGVTRPHLRLLTVD